MGTGPLSQMGHGDRSTVPNYDLYLYPGRGTCPSIPLLHNNIQQYTQRHNTRQCRY